MKAAEDKDYFGAICTVSRAFGTTLDRDELLELIAGSALETMKVKAALLFLHHEERDRFRAAAHKGLSETYIKKGLTHPVKLVPILEKEGHFFAYDCTTDERLDGHDLKKAEGLASLLVVPVMVKGKLIGGLALFTDSPRNFSREEIDFASAMAEQGGMAIENARLVEQIRQNTKLFLNLAVDINSSLNIKEVMHALTVNVAETTGVKASAVLLLDEKTGKLECVAGHGLSDRYLNRGPLFIEGSIQQTMEGNPVLIRDVAADPRVKHKKEKESEGIVSLLSLPIKTRQGVIGVLRLYSAVPREFNEDEMKLLSALAHLGGIAIQNASLYLMLEKDMKDLREEIWTHRCYF
ncbi:MAG: GAF domain-containing protein [Syntrophobacteraceae bacterium]|jgi:GAF domain-containing protein